MQVVKLAANVLLGHEFHTHSDLVNHSLECEGQERESSLQNARDVFNMVERLSDSLHGAVKTRKGI